MDIAKLYKKEIKLTMSFPKCLLTLNFNRLVGFRLRSSDLHQMSSHLYSHKAAACDTNICIKYAKSSRSFILSLVNHSEETQFQDNIRQV